jgi:acetylornithine/N-succinyldiaminopimelate aminotransferase
MTGYLEAYRDTVMGTYGPPRRVLVRGAGCRVWDADGREYLDLLAGIAVNALGHAHPRLVDAVSTQLATLGHISNLFTSPAQVRLARRLLDLVGVGAPGAPATGAVFFANSGAEANEAAFKIARRTGRPRIIAASGGFHGRTMGALALTGKPAIAEPFSPLPGGVEHVPFGDLPALEAGLGDDVAAVVLEPIQGEAGVWPAPPGYLRAVRDLTRRHGSLLVLDEVQTGVGRTGTWFAFQHPDALGPGAGPEQWPDVVTVAKGLGGGIPIGALLALGEAGQLLGPGQHGSTFGGNPVACAAAAAVLDVIGEDGLLDAATARGRELADGLAGLGDDRVGPVRGRGLLLAVPLQGVSAAAASRAALDAGFIVNDVAPDALRLAPPLVLGSAEAASFVAALPAILDTAAHPGSTP